MHKTVIISWVGINRNAWDKSSHQGWWTSDIKADGSIHHQNWWTGIHQGGNHIHRDPQCMIMHFTLLYFTNLSSFFFLCSVGGKLVVSTHLLPRSAESSLPGRPLIPDQNHGHWPHVQAEPSTPKQSGECPTDPLRGGAKTFAITFS